MQFAWGYVPPLVLEAAIRHRVFDTLDSGAKTVSEIARETGASERGLTGIMNVLVSLDFLAKDADGRYSLTPESAAFLVSSKPGFLGGMLRHGSEHLIPRWLNLNEVVATGRPVQPVNQEGPGSDFFQDFVNDIFPMNYPSAKALGQYLDYDAQPLARQSLNLDWPNASRSSKATFSRQTSAAAMTSQSSATSCTARAGSAAARCWQRPSVRWLLAGRLRLPNSW
jgi:hypothetical protein